MIDSNLLKLAAWKLQRSEKKGFVPPGGGMDPMMGGGMPPMDPMMGGGMPPMDPMMGGGMPPMDPAMMGGAPPAPAPPPAEAPADPAAGGAVKKPKLDPAAIYVEQVRNRKLLIGLYQQLGLNLPENILDDEDIIAPGVIDKPKPAEPPKEEGPTGLPPVGDSPAINPIEPAQMAGPSIADLMGQPGQMPM